MTAEPRKQMDLTEFVEFGYLQEVNRCFLHPLGLALEVTREEDGTHRLSGIWDAREPEFKQEGLPTRVPKEGIHFVGPKAPRPDKAQRVAEEFAARATDRTRALGYVVQPIRERPIVLYFGCDNDSAGHFFFEPGMRSAHRRDTPAPEKYLPWGHVDGKLAPQDGPQVEGKARLHHLDGWSALAWWDRSVDSRGGSNANLIAEGRHDFEQMIALGEKHFPEVMARFDYEIVPA